MRVPLLSLLLVLLAAPLALAPGAAATALAACVPAVEEGSLCVDPDGRCPVSRVSSDGAEWCPQDDIVIVRPAPRCVLLGHDLEYSHYVCVDPMEPRCAVYLWTVGGSTDVKRCYLLKGELDLGGEAEAAGSCIPTSGGMDYHSYLCVDPKNPRCAVYTLSTTDWGTTKRCFPGV